MLELVFGSDAASARSTHSAAFLWQYSAVIISATPRSTLRYISISDRQTKTL